MSFERVDLRLLLDGEGSGEPHRVTDPVTGATVEVMSRVAAAEVFAHWDRENAWDFIERAANGRVWKAACPFHDDDGESFYVHADGFHCFGCGAHGDAIDFVMRPESAPSEDAVAILAGQRA